MNKEKISENSSLKKTRSPTFVKLAMRNMVRKGNKSLYHLIITAFGFIGFIVLLASLIKPNIPI
tara:strand:+ start:35 stop:226 length:192 start_codon:yes stop_codon:yes gene_type:complete